MKKILIIDDDRMWTEFCKTLFALQPLKQDYQLLIAHTIKQGLKLAQQEQPDLILLEIFINSSSSLSTKKGYQALKLLKQNPKIKNIPVIINTALHYSKQDPETVKQLGALDSWDKTEVNEPSLIQKRIEEVLGG